MKRLAVWVLLLLFADSSYAFVLVNRTGQDISTVYVSPSGYDDWENMSVTVPNGERVRIPYGGKAAHIEDYSIMAEFPDGTSQEWGGIDLPHVEVIELGEDGGISRMIME